ncbi:MAG: hypothetical protein Q8P33_01690 [bacterium]|nr:hypothetical protein [bacterium]
MTVFAEQWSEVFGAVHGLLVLISIFALVMAVIFTFAVSQHNWRHITISSLVATIGYLATFGFGLLVYPRFRVYVRGAFLDARAPNSTGLFEIKEHVAAVGFFVALALLVVLLFGRLRRASTWRKQLFAALLMILALITLIVAALSYVLQARKP